MTTSKDSLDIIEEVLRDTIYEGEYFSTQWLYSEYCHRVKDNNDFRDEKDKIAAVSFTTFWRYQRKFEDIHALDKIRYGRVQADLNKNGSRKKVRVKRPLERVEIDWTPLDVMLIHPETLKPAKPWLVYAIDKYTSHILGFFVTFNDVDAAAVKQCILHCIMPKTYVKDLYPEVENSWNTYGKPELIVVDNSTINDSMDIADACLQMGIDIQFCEVDSGNQKGSIERAFKTLNTKLIHSLKGTTFSNILERGRYDSVGNACITMQGFIYMAHIAIIDLISNQFSTSKGYTPADLWEKALNENKDINLSIPQSKKELKIIFIGGFKPRTVTNKGVSIQNEYYTSDDLMDLRYQLSKLYSKLEVKVRYDLNDMRSIYVYDEFNKRYIEAFQTDLESKNVLIQYPVHFSDLKLDSSERTDRKNKIDKTSIARGSRKIKKIEENDKKQVQNLIATSEKIEVPNKKSTYEGISSLGISFQQLNISSNNEEIIILDENENQKENLKKQKEHKSFSTNSPSFELDDEEFPDWDISFKK